MFAQDFELANTIDLPCPGSLKNRRKSFNTRALPKKSELEDYELSNSIFYLEETIGTGGFGKVKKEYNSCFEEKNEPHVLQGPQQNLGSLKYMGLSSKI